MKIMIPILALVLAAGAVPASAWGSPEHKALGDGAWTKALADLDKEKEGTSARLLALLGRAGGAEANPDEPIVAQVDHQPPFATFSLGDMVAIYGDWVLKPEDVNDAAFSSRAASLKQIVSGQKEPSKEEFDYMVKLASNNYTHFSAEAVEAYSTWHSQALEYAKDPGTLQLAMHFEAAALHSFTDLFAFGHMMEDRELTKAVVAWAEKTQNAFAQVAAGKGALVTGAMANFYHNAYNTRGANVRSLAGETWFATGDDRLEGPGAGGHKGPEMSLPVAGLSAFAGLAGSMSQAGGGGSQDAPGEGQKAQVVMAAAESLGEVLRVALGEPLPPGGKFAAMNHLPVVYWNYYVPVAPKDQIPNLLVLIPAQAKVGRPIQEHGFDFTLGILKFKPEATAEAKVKYYDKVKKLVTP